MGIVFNLLGFPLVSNYEITVHICIEKGSERLVMTAFEAHKDELEKKLRLIRTERYACQSVARKALPGERVSMCLRKINGSYVDVYKHRKTHKAFYAGLMVCGSVWTCPVCAAKISEKRKKEIEQAFEIHKSNGGKIAMLTLTFSHKKFHNLKDLLDKFGQATQKFMSGRAYNDIRLFMGLIGRIRVYEVTYGENGYHPHAHIALFYENEINLKVMQDQMFDLWKKACHKVGLTTGRKNGLHLESAEQAEQYLSKHGTWSLEQELSKSHVKKAKNGSMSPFDFLREYLKSEDIKYLNLFKDYAECFKGKRQIQWSQGLKKQFVLVDKSDEELAKEKTEEADILGTLDYEQWREILKSDNRSYFLDLCEKYSFDKAVNITQYSADKIKKESSWHEDSQIINEI